MIVRTGSRRSPGPQIAFNETRRGTVLSFWTRTSYTSCVPFRPWRAAKQNIISTSQKPSSFVLAFDAVRDLHIVVPDGGGDRGGVPDPCLFGHLRNIDQDPISNGLSPAVGKDDGPNRLVADSCRSAASTTIRSAISCQLTLSKAMGCGVCSLPPVWRRATSDLLLKLAGQVESGRLFALPKPCRTCGYVRAARQCRSA